MNTATATDVTNETHERESVPSLTATFSCEDNKLRLYSVHRLDAETYARVSEAGFSWASKQKFFVAPKWTPEREDLLLDLCGEIDDEDSTLAERAEVRADRFDGYSDKRAAEAHSARARVAEIADNIPLGQPILCGHHSERHARRAAEKIRSGMNKAVRLWDTSKYWESRAERVTKHAAYKANPRVRANRIKTLEAEQRAHQRVLTKAADVVARWTEVSAIVDPDAQRVAAIETARHLDLYRTEGDLTAGRVTGAEAAALRIASCGRSAAHAKRWIAHLTNRLAYERVLLGRAPDEVTKVDRTRKGKSALPLLNYKADTIEVLNRWHHGQTDTLTQATMTAAQYARIHAESKGTEASADGTHRIRIAYPSLGAKVAVFLSDSKAHPVPVKADPEPTEPEVADVEDASGIDADEQDTANESARAEGQEHVESHAANDVEPQQEVRAVDPFEAMRRSLKAGVQVVAVPELYQTSPALAARLVEAAGVRPGDRVLEPSAGLGAIATAARDAGGLVECVEINHAAASRLVDLGFTTHCGDFLETTRDPIAAPFDRVCMNPPFAKQADISHVTHAFGMLRVGGTLAAIMSAGVKYQANRAGKAFRALVAANDGEIVDLPEGSFAAAGTGVRTVLVTMTRME